MKIKPLRELQIMVAVVTIPAAFAIAYALPNGILKWVSFGVLVLLGGVAEWMIDRALINSKNSNSQEE